MMAMAVGGFSSGGGGGGGGGGRGGGSSKYPGRGTRDFANRDRNAGAIRLARFEGALARIAWDHYAGVEVAAAAAAAAPAIGSLAAATVPEGAVEPSIVVKGREALKTPQPAATLASRLDAFLTVFFMPNLRRVAGR